MGTGKERRKRPAWAGRGWGEQPGGQVAEAMADRPALSSVPVSRPVLTLSPPGPRALKGDVMTLHCEARRGSSYILYRFYCEDVVLGSRQAPSGAGASFRLALREEHSANYSCTADNGFGPPQRSEAVSLWVVGKPSVTHHGPDSHQPLQKPAWTSSVLPRSLSQSHLPTGCSPQPGPEAHSQLSARERVCSCRCVLAYPVGSRRVKPCASVRLKTRKGAQHRGRVPR